jgi:hypothetical protein
MNDDTYDNHTCHDNCPRIACVLRRELTAMTEQRDRLQKIVDEQCRFSSVCREYREQRDEARECLERCARSRCELGARLRSRIVYFENQRDRMAEALRSIKNELGIPQPEYPTPVANAVKIADAAIQSITNKQND